MNNASITKTLSKVKNQPSNYSLGFRRLNSLPLRIRENINLACILKGESNDNSMKDYLGSLTDSEFINFLKIS